MRFSQAAVLLTAVMTGCANGSPAAEQKPLSPEQAQEERMETPEGNANWKEETTPEDLEIDGTGAVSEENTDREEESGADGAEKPAEGEAAKEGGISPNGEEGAADRRQETPEDEALEQKEAADGGKTEQGEISGGEKQGQMTDGQAKGNQLGKTLAEIELDADAPEAPIQPVENSSAVGYNDRKSWWFKRNSEHVPPSAQHDIAISRYDAYYLGDTSRKVIYLTFDEGYENGYSEKILDILKEKQVQAAFFVTKSYIKANPELVSRMVAEGHVVGNHSVTHSDFTTLSDEEIKGELLECADYFYEVTGTQMPPFFRPPEGVYSIRSLEATQACGFQTIFWSYAYQDWDVNNQPGREAAYEMAMNNDHNGAIMLLHAVSQSNTEALADIIDSYREKGYTFVTLYDLP